MPGENLALPSMNNWTKYSDVILSIAVVVVVVMMIVPLPPIMLDLLLTLNITAALTILLVTMYTLEPLQFSVFPSLLLIATIFRLALNVSATRLVLANAYAGEVIKIFGSFVVGGGGDITAVVVGAVIFLIIVVIQFVVITSGAQRVAEVAARFTLDAMPGKQMAIDADLNAGLITDDEARARRRGIEKEADFYGAMDGASKFVRGDAIAAIIITIINIIAGLAIGVTLKGFAPSVAVLTYTILTIGEGLVTQIPALLLSTATGLIVTRAASESNLGQDLSRQIIHQPRVFYVVAAVLFVFGLIFPSWIKVPFIMIAILCAIGAYLMSKAYSQEIVLKESKAKEQKEAVKTPEDMVPLLQVDPLEIELGYALIPLVEVSQGGDLLDRITNIRKQIALDLGLVVPPIRVRDNVQLKPTYYLIKIKGAEVAKGEIVLGHYLAINSGAVTENISGIPTKEPTFGLPAQWITEAEKEKAELAGYTVVDATAVIATHLTEVIRFNADLLLGRQEVQKLIDHVKRTNPAVVEELTPSLMMIGEIQKVLKNLLKEKVSIRDLVTIFEALADQARNTKDLETLTEYARQACNRSITKQYLNEEGKLPALTLDPKLEQIIQESIQQTERGYVLAIEPKVGRQIFSSLAREIERIAREGFLPVLLCAPVIRPFLKRFVEKILPNLVILSFNDISSNVEVQSLGIVGIPNEN